ncbi:MaoC family dehydratase N-terminal domain-containing protein [Bacillus tianshenii]|nr:MaoC family dehydratase N-terminal domain-containing protein [Bacillus tianshenii]
MNLEKTFPLKPFTIERGKIAEFVQAIGDSNPVYTDIETAREEGFRDIPIPPTFPTVVEMWAGIDFETIIEELDLNLLRVLHGEQSYEYLQDVCAGDTISGVGYVTDVVDKKRLTIVKLQMDFFNQAEEKVLIGRSIVIETKEETE